VRASNICLTDVINLLEMQERRGRQYHLATSLSETLLGMSDIWRCVISAVVTRGFVLQPWAANLGRGKSRDLVC
jgi:hypothetical protein